MLLAHHGRRYTDTQCGSVYHGGVPGSVQGAVYPGGVYRHIQGGRVVGSLPPSTHLPTMVHTLHSFPLILNLTVI